jgi:hypothetical protein
MAEVAGFEANEAPIHFSLLVIHVALTGDCDASLQATLGLAV